MWNEPCEVRRLRRGRDRGTGSKRWWPRPAGKKSLKRCVRELFYIMCPNRYPTFLHSKMSDFSQLKQQRKAQKARSFVTNAAPVHGEPEKQETDGPNNMAVVDPGVSSQGRSSGPIPLDIHGRYSAIPPTLSVRVTGKNGRGIYSKFNRTPGESSSFSAGFNSYIMRTRIGEILLSVKPHVAALSNQHLEDYCSSCFSPRADSLRRCTGCKLLYYCDEVCCKIRLPWAHYSCFKEMPILRLEISSGRMYCYPKMGCSEAF